MEASFEKIQPKASALLGSALYIGARESMTLNLEATVYSVSAVWTGRRVGSAESDAHQRDQLNDTTANVQPAAET